MVVDTIVVFTGESIEEILEQGGSSRWRLNLKWASEHKYVVCVRNAKADWTTGTEAHRSAFLVGKICDFVPEVEPAKGNRPPQDRYLIKCSHYALIDIPDLWNKGDQYPVRYKSMTEIGIDPSKGDSTNGNTVLPPCGYLASAMCRASPASCRDTLLIDACGWPGHPCRH